MKATRRDVLKATGFIAVAGGTAIRTSVRAVSATSSGEAELTVDATVPSGTSLDVTIEEYETSGESNLISSQTKSVTDPSSTIEYADLEGNLDTYYVFEVSFGGGENTPEVGSLSLSIPGNFAFQDYTDAEWQAKAENVNITFDEKYLYDYQPQLLMDVETRQSHKGLYGYVASSEDKETDVLCYFSQYTHQDGLPLVGADSHLGDHEPIYVFVNKETGEVETVVYSGYHWYASEVSADQVRLSTDRREFPTHATFKVINQWHNYQFVSETDGAFVDVQSWPAVKDSWKQNGFYKSANADAIENPWTMLDAESWWSNSSTDAYFADLWAGLGLRFGWYGGGSVDNLRR